MGLDYLAIARLASNQGLHPLGGFATDSSEAVLPKGTRSLVLLGPDGPRFWPVLTASPEFSDRQPSPVDRWSHRVIGAIAVELGGTALFPFGQTPPLPFISWAMRSGQSFVSAANLLIHIEAGLWVSFRGALALPFEVDFPAAGKSPCDTCVHKPCLTACPAGALTGAGYDIPACHAFLDTAPGQNCMAAGCLVRRACPVSQGHGRPPEQSAHHMSYFHR